MSAFDEFFKTNKETWDKKVKVHTQSEMYELETFKKGKSSLKQYELEALGDINNKSLLHLQCHFGQDTMSLARLGAKCVGVDISEEGIKTARELNKELELECDFVCCNVLDTNKHISDSFDIVFTSYGVIGWLPDLRPWAQIIASRLKSGGFFYMVEFHPIVWMFDYLDGEKTLKYGYMQKEVIYEEYEGTYADENSKMLSKEYGWNHGLSEVVNSLIEAGLTIDYLNEYDESPYDVLPDLIPASNGHYVSKDKLYPLIFSIKSTKP